MLVLSRVDIGMELNHFLALGLVLSLGIQLKFIVPYLNRRNQDKSIPKAPVVKILSVNVYQENQNFDAFLKLVKSYDPDVILTLETNKAWEDAMQPLEKDFPYFVKEARENTYGMHFYSKIKVLDHQVHGFITAERPAMELMLENSGGKQFKLWGLHPPPPSPTEKENSKQKDAELMLVAKELRQHKNPCIVVGDFNNVCWSRSSKMFAKLSGLRDARIGRGIYGTFPVRPWLFRFPIDLVFHSEAVLINKIGTLEDIGSDHLPLFTEIQVNGSLKEDKPDYDAELEQEASEMVHEGKKDAQDDEELQN